MSFTVYSYGLLSVSILSVALSHFFPPPTPDRVPWRDVFSVAVNGPGALVAFTGGWTILGVACGIPAALSAWTLWQWWRRRRQGKPSRVLGVIRDVGHKLVVAPVAGDAR